MKKRHGLAIIALLSAAALMLGGCSSTNQHEASSDSAGGVHINLKGDYNPMERDQIKDGGEFILPIYIPRKAAIHIQNIAPAPPVAVAVAAPAIFPVPT